MVSEQDKLYIAAIVFNEIFDYRNKKIKLGDLSSNMKLASIIKIKSKASISTILSECLSKTELDYRQQLLLKRNGSVNGKRTMREKTGIFDEAERPNYASIGGNGSFNKKKGIHALTSDEKSYHGQMGRLIYLLAERVNSR